MTSAHDKKMQKIQLVWDHIAAMPQGLKETDTVAMPALVKYIQNVTKHNAETCHQYAQILTGTGSLHLKVQGDRKTQWQAWVAMATKPPTIDSGDVGKDYQTEMEARFEPDAGNTAPKLKTGE